MKIGVLVKQVVTTESNLTLGEQGTWVDEAGINFAMNECDSYALEEAIQIKEKNGGGEVIVISIGPPDRTPKIIREALAKGADRGIHIIDTIPFIADPIIIAEMIVSAVKDENLKLLLAGLQSDDLAMGQTGLITGELLGMSTCTMVVGTELKGDKIRVKKELESGWSQWVTLDFPACITIQSGINQPRYPSLKGIMGAKRKEIKTIQKEDLNIDLEPFQSINSLYVQKKDKKTEMIEGDQVISRLVEILKNEVKVI